MSFRPEPIARHRRRSYAVLASLLAAGMVIANLAGCEDDDGDNGMEPPDDTTFAEDVQPILQQTCAVSGCHDATSAVQGLRLDTYDNLLAGSDHGDVVIPFASDRSLMIQLLDGRAEATPDHSVILPFLGEDQRRAGPVVLHDEELETIRAWIADGCRNDAGVPAYSNVTDRVFVTNQGSDSISEISVDDLVVTRLVDVEPFAGALEAFPHFGVVSQDNSMWFATLLRAPGLWEFDAADTVQSRLQTNLGAPALAVMLPDNSKAYVSHFINPQMPGLGHVSVIDVPSFTVTQELAVLNTPHGIALSPDGGEVYVANFGSDHITVIDTSDDSIAEHIPISENVRGNIDSFEYRVIQIAAHPTEPYIYASCTLSPTSPGGEVRVIDRSQGTAIDSLAVPGGTAAPWHLRVSPDGSRLVVALRGQQLGSQDLLPGAVAIYSTDPFAHLATIQDPALALPHGVDFDADGRYAFVASENLNGAYTARYPIDGFDPGTVAIVDMASNQLVKVLEVETFATGVFATH